MRISAENCSLTKEAALLDGISAVSASKLAPAKDADNISIPGFVDDAVKVNFSKRVSPKEPPDENDKRPNFDIDGSGVVDLADLGYLLSKFRQKDRLADFDGNGVVNHVDLILLLEHYGERV